MRNRSAYPIPKYINLAVIVAQLAAMFAIFYGAAVATEWWQLALLAATFGIVGNSVYAIMHEAEHGLLHPNRRMNTVLGSFMAMFFPAPYHLIRQGHLGHHQRNRSDDEAFDLYFASESAFLRWLQLYGILTGFYWCVVALSNVVVVLCPAIMTRRHWEFNRPSAALMDSLNPRYWRIIRLEGLLVILLHSAIVWGLDIPILHYFVVYFGFGFSWSAMQYVHHFETSRHVLRGARNLWFLAPIDIIWLNHNWHLTHHQQPTVPWIYLSTLGKEQDPNREFMIWHYLRMWKGPRLTDEHVENKYAGRIIK